MSAPFDDALIAAVWKAMRPYLGSPHPRSVQITMTAIEAVREFDARAALVAATLPPDSTAIYHDKVNAKILVNVRSQMFPVALPPVIDLPDRF